MQHTEQRLSNISSIRTGYTFRGKIESRQTGTITVLQPKDIMLESLTKSAKIESWEINSLQNHLLKKGDILVANKGLRFSTFLYNGTPTDCIASSSFFIITVDQKKILPEYLMWYLDQAPAKNYLLGRVTGSIIPSINKSAIQGLSLPLPTLAIQEYISQLLNLSSDELHKLQQLRELRIEFYNSHIWEKIIQEIGK